MGRAKTRRKNRSRGGLPLEDQDPDVSEAEPSSSENVSESLNDTFVLNSTTMDTDVEDSEQTGGSTPADELDTTATDDKVDEPSSINVDMASDIGDVQSPIDSPDNSQLNQWLDDQQTPSQPPTPASLTCPHIKSSVSMAGIRKAFKGEINIACAARPCMQRSDEELIGAGDAGLSSKELWICLQCGNFGCGDQNAQGGDAFAHYKTPRSDQHNIVLSIGGESEKSWCYNCQTSVETKLTQIKDTVQFIKRITKSRLTMQQSKNKTDNAPVIALGPPPPPPQPETSHELTQKKPFNYKNKSNRGGLYNSSNYGDSSSINRDEWPLGLENLGNTCFMNSALQCLSRTKSLIPKLDLYGSGNVIEILVTADPPSVHVQDTVESITNGDGGDNSTLFQLASPMDAGLMDENGDGNIISSITGTGTGGSSPSSTEMDSLLDVASGTSSKSSPMKESLQDDYKEEIEVELKKCLRLKLVIPKDSMTSRLRHAFKAMTRSAHAQPGAGSYSTSEYFSRGRNVFTPNSIHMAMAKNFRPGQQHDSHELLRNVVDMMKKDQIKAFRLAIMDSYGIKKTEGKNCDPKTAELLKMWDRKLYHKTFVDEIFGGELVTFQTCETCGSVRKSYEDFLDISLPIRVYSKNAFPRKLFSMMDDDSDSGNRSLEACLKLFTEAEQLNGSNAVECENCHRLNLERLAEGASFEEVFPGVKPPEPEVTKHEPPVETEIYNTEPLEMEEGHQPSFATFDNTTEDMDDLDEPAVDGIIGNTSDMEDEGNDVPPLYLGESEEKGIASDFLSPDIPKENASLSLAATQDEGFSESDSSEEKKSASISASSSRNSISEAENGMSQKKEQSKPIPITKCPCNRRQMVWRPPDCLTIHLKRFQITSHGTSKLGDRVNFPYILNLTQFCAPRDVQNLQDEEGNDFFDEDGEIKYALYGIVEHSGSLHWGHYVAYIKVPGANSSADSSNSNSLGGSSDKWYYISDSSVSSSSLETVLGMDPYILFYERIRGQEKKDRIAQFHRITNPTPTVCEPTPTATSHDSTEPSTVNYSLD